MNRFYAVKEERGEEFKVYASAGAHRRAGGTLSGSSRAFALLPVPSLAARPGPLQERGGTVQREVRGACSGSAVRASKPDGKPAAAAKIRTHMHPTCIPLGHLRVGARRLAGGDDCVVVK